MLGLTTGLMAQITELPSAVVKAPRFQPNENMVRLAKNEKKAAIYNYLESYLEYPTDATKYNEQGMVIVEFVVDVDGSLKDFTVANSVSDVFDNCVINCLSQTSGKWIPAEVNGIATPMTSKVYVKFFSDDADFYTQTAINHYMAGIKHIDKGNTLQQADMGVTPKIHRQYNRAIYDLDEATKLYPECLAIAYQQMRTYEKLGDEIHRQQWFEKCTEILTKAPIDKTEKEFAVITKK